MPNLIYWTLQNDFPQEWQPKFTELDYSIQHTPLIELTVNKSYSIITDSVDNFDELIISSQFAAQKISTTLKNQKYKFYIVGSQASSILKEAGHEILHVSENSESLAAYIKHKTDVKILHLCSEKSNVDIWPNNVKTVPFYSPTENTNFNLKTDNIDRDSIIVFGSPSGVDIWFTKNIDISDSTIAAIGKTTANRFSTYTNKPIIVPKISTINHLCEAIYNHLKHSNYEPTE
ncbi:MAG: uroporphyrinogen-III synthase [Candidatus Marinimicrobia bacterium]|nr:uroporphyrinogen-III synthase [Candidatus Neomarinimicrobiota bacterium]